MQRQHEPNIKTKSAARLAAEAAFAPPRQTSEPLFANGSPAITVLRIKRPAALAERIDAGQSEVSDVTPSSEHPSSVPKAPRVFLLTSAHAKSGSTPAEWSQGQVQTEEAGQASHQGLGGAASTPVRRASRSRNRPPPVTLVFSAPAAVGSDGAGKHGSDFPMSPARAPRDPPAHISTSLASALAAIEPTFVVIRSAMCFTLEAPLVTAQWERLSGALDQIAVEIKASSRSETAG